MRFLVTGAAGFIGSHLSDRLLRAGHGVVGLDNFDPYYAEKLKRFYIRRARNSDRYRLVEGDVREEEAWETTTRAVLELPYSTASGPATGGEDPAPFDAVVHLAALAGVHPSVEWPARYQSVNVGGTQQGLEFARRHGIPSFVFGSSSSVYGEREEVPFSEEDRVDRPISPYAATKRAGELLCHTHHHLFGLKVLCLRLFTVYGPRQRPDLAIHRFARLISRRQPIPRFGDGSSRRDYTYITDVLQGITAGLDYLEAHDDVYEIVNLGESETVELSRLIELVGRAMGAEPRIRAYPDQPGDVHQTYADISKARRLLGYEPTTSIEEGVDRFVRWFRDNKARLT